MIFVEYVLPYIVALITAICSGIIAYLSAIKKCKLDNEVRIKEIQEQHKLDLENQKELFKLEMDKIGLQHQNELEKLKVEGNNQLTNNLASGLVSSLFSNPQTISSLFDLKKKLEEFKDNNQ